MGIDFDFDGDGTPMGIEITAPLARRLPRSMRCTLRLGQPPLDSDDWAPLRAA